jgi:hypothetical protein
MATETCPAALPLCLCGIRGCAFAEQHRTAWTIREPKQRRPRKKRRR